MKHFTYHVRLTKACNADCSYCSSWQETPSRMSLEDYIASTQFVFERYLSNFGITPEYVTVQFIGGELLTYPQSELEDIVRWTKEYFKPVPGGFSFGGQSNLIGSSRKVQMLFELMDGRLGTSFDGFSESRTLSGDSSKYRNALANSVNVIEATYDAKVPGVVVLGGDPAESYCSEYMNANQHGRDITFRPLFSGGKDNELASSEHQANVLMRLMDLWLMKGEVKLEPLYNMVKKRLSFAEGVTSQRFSGCPSQKDCTEKSISLEPNGDMFLCQEMSDSGLFKIGNALSEKVDTETFNNLSFRRVMLSNDCLSCEYLDSCQGGCMLEAYQFSHDLYGKPPLCGAWKQLYSRIDSAISVNGFTRVNQWLHGL